MSGRDIPRYGDGNESMIRTLSRLVRPEGTSPGMGTETLLSHFSPMVDLSPEGTYPGMGTETVATGSHYDRHVSGRDIPRYGDGKFFELKCLAKKMNRKREIGFLN